MIWRTLARGLCCQQRGTVAIETAIVAPVLLLLSLGAFEVSSLVARQGELQSAANEGETIALTFADGATTDLATIKNILKSSIGLTSDQMTLSMQYRCGVDEVLVQTDEECDPGDIVSTYVQLHLTDQYQPLWTSFGVGKPITMDITRRVQVS